MRRTNLTTIATDRGLAFAGRFDAHEIDAVAADLDALSHRDGDIELDLSAVRYLDGAAIGLIDRARTAARARGRELHVSAASQAATIILELAHRAGIAATTVAAPATREAVAA